ncbi:GNAT family N-acetyltransferase [Salinibacillus xinjiangensis]|uniref:GNAT family N-acetyltransferase n=1 Tax=Salinibacillus xinjiangensis TaxID=1229268 RepID=A0A6G1X9F5_9BACI|nr:GNAT family N-acetyltransferase [Salinibacillus xinjiangensis]MRG87559.1 GNAT family N-acetyltransferase [Salinibacillus xinjiangensis]
MNPIHKLSEKDFKDIFSLSQFAFQYRLSDEEIKKKTEETKRHVIWGIKEGDELAAKLHLIPLSCYINGKSFPMGGISNVATWPEFRRQGMVKQLLAHALQYMKANGQTLSFLHPFSFPFYRRYGWEYTFNEKEYTIPIEKFKKKWETKGYMRRIKHDYTLLDQVYNEYAKNYNGMLNRDEKWWKQRVLKEEYQVAVSYDEHEAAAGYVIYQVKKDIMNIMELVYTNLASLKQLLEFIGNHDSMVKKVEMVVPENDTLPLLIDEPRFEQKINPYFMARIVDVQKFLKDFSYEQPSDESATSIAITVEDDFFPENSGTYFIQPSSNNVSYSRSVVKSESIQCSIQILTGMFLGFKRPMEYYDTGLLSGDVSSIQHLEKLIPHRQTFLADFF